MEKIRVVQLIHGLNMGGAETLVKEYVLRLDKRKFDVVVLCYNHLDSPYYDIIERAGISIIYICDELSTWGKNDLISRVINHFGSYICLKKKLHELNPDVVHFHLCMSRFVKFANLPKNVRLVYSQHFSVDTWIKEYKKEINAVRFLLKKYHMRIIALSDEMKGAISELFDHLYDDNIVILKNGIDFSRFSESINRDDYRKKLGIEKDSYVVGHVGRLVEVKNHVYILNVFSEIIKRQPKAFLLLVGSGEKKSAIINLAKQLAIDDKVMILSNRTDVPQLMKVMDCFLFPSFSEGIPVTLIEAQSAGLRCLVSDAITSEIAISNLVRFRDIKLPPQYWAEEILAWNDGEINHVKNSEWDINNVVHRLESFYLS